MHVQIQMGYQQIKIVMKQFKLKVSSFIHAYLEMILVQ